jgi:BatD DUF11 like domain
MRLPPWALASVATLWVAATPARATVRAWLDTSEAAPGDTVELTLEYQGQASGQPDLAPLNRDFDVLDSNTSTSIEIVNGRASARTLVTVSLAPRHAGRLIVPPIAWSGEQSPSLALNVAPAARGSAAQARPVFLETEVDPKRPYVQAAVRVTLRLYTREALYKTSIGFESGPAAVIRQIGPDEEGSVERGGESYEVLTRHYLLFPQQSGALTLPGPVLNAEIPQRRRSNVWGSDPFAGVFGVNPLVGTLVADSKPIRLRGDSITLDVRPRPAGASSYWLPARELTLSGAWHPPVLQAHVGDPVTVDLTLQAEGLTAAQLPDLTQLLELPSGVRAYPDAPKLTDATRDEGIVGTRAQSIALIAGQPGRFVVPALHVHWWDTRSNEARDAVLPERQLVVLPAADAGVRAAPAGAAQAPLPADTRSSPLSGSPPQAVHLARSRSWRDSAWAWVSAGLALAWAATLLAWLRLHRRMATATGKHRSEARPQSRSGPSLPDAREAFLAACRCNDAAGARRHLLAWVRVASAGPAAAGLNALARQLGDARLARLVRELDRACYAGAPWSGDALAAGLSELPFPRQGRGRGADPALAPLYP